MRRGGHKVKPTKASQDTVTTTTSAQKTSTAATQSTKLSTDQRRISFLSPTFRSRSSSEVRASSDQDRSSRESSRHRTSKLDSPSEIAEALKNLDLQAQSDTIPSSIPQTQCSSQSPSELTPSVSITESEDMDDEVSDSFNSLSSTSARSSASSIFSEDATSSYSRASSIYSREASIYSLDECTSEDLNRQRTESVTRESRSQSQQHTRSLSVRRQETEDAASQERSTMAKKAAMFKNSRLAPGLPEFSASLPTWAMVCRAVQASRDCYDSRTLTRLGTYTAADTSKDIKAMIVDDQLIDGSRLLIVSIRGTQFQCLSDWAVNADAKPIKPTGFLDDEDNACHSGFLVIAKAMVQQVAAQLKQHPASSERPSLLFTGHSAGGAVAAMLYSHMLSTSVSSELTALASQFPSIHCVTFGAPPLSLRPLPRRDNGSGVFLTFANEGDPVLRLSNAAYLKSLAKLRTASPPPSLAGAAAAAPVKVVRGSRGSTVYRQAAPPPPSVPWEELPLWPTPPCPLTNAGDIVLLRDRETGRAVASRVAADDLEGLIFGDLAEHTTAMYVRRVSELALAAMMGRNVF